MRRLCKCGWLWLLLLSSLLGVYQIKRGFDKVDYWPDSVNYLDLYKKDLADEEGLRHLRTWGYPLMLQAYRAGVDRLGPTWSWWLVFDEQDPHWLTAHHARQILPGCWLIFEEIHDPWAYLPTCHLLLHIFAVLMLYAGWRQIGFPKVAAVLVCLPVLFFDMIDLTHSLLTDSPGQSLTILAISAFLFVLSKPRRPLRWLLLTLVVFAAWQTRPVSQYLVVMLPLAGWLLRSYAGAARNGLRRFTLPAMLLLVCCVPLLAFCGWRYHVVGHFGVVSFMGHNLIGLTGCLLTEEMLPEIREECQPLARMLLERRNAPDVLSWWGRRPLQPPLEPGDTDVIRHIADVICHDADAVVDRAVGGVVRGLAKAHARRRRLAAGGRLVAPLAGLAHAAAERAALLALAWLPAAQLPHPFAECPLATLAALAIALTGIGRRLAALLLLAVRVEVGELPQTLAEGAALLVMMVMVLLHAGRLFHGLLQIV